MILELRPGCSVLTPGSVPQRRRVIVIGATDAGLSAAHHLGAAAMLIEERGTPGEYPDVSVAERMALYEAALDKDTLSGVKRWRPPDLTCGEVRMGTRVTAIHAVDRRLEISTGESFVYDKLVSTVKLAELLQLMRDEQPDHVRDVEWWHYWLSIRGIEHIDQATQQFNGDVDGASSGKRIADLVRCSLTARYASGSSLRLVRTS